ncbi:MAG: hypothetical protein ACI841_000262 [Planctomycetota bacterium]|jgi:hypothetical protein
MTPLSSMDARPIVNASTVVVRLEINASLARAATSKAAKFALTSEAKAGVFGS